MNKITKQQLKIFKYIVLGLAGFTALLGLGYLVLTWNQPLSPALNLPTETPSPGPAFYGTETPSVSVTPTLTPTIEPVCGGPPTMNILVSGVASNTYLYGLADAVRVARIDFQNKKVTVLALPRDLWVQIPGLEAHGIAAGKLNQAYFYGTEGMGYYSGAGYGSGLLAETLQNDYGFRSDHFLSVNLYSFRKIIDTIGGIDVYLSQDVYKKVNEQPKLFLKAGSHHLTGKEAEMLARNRITIGDFGRINNQSVVLRAVAAKLLSPTGVAALPSLVEQLKSNVLTDLSPAEISQLVCLAGMLDYQEDLTFVTLPEELMVEQMVYDPVRGLNTSALVGDDPAIRQLLNDFDQRLWP
jgi:LCP family protein required for cell wall assembly